MVTTVEQCKNLKPKKKQKLRNNEYYDVQNEFDKLYDDSVNNKVFKNLLPMITDIRNIKLAFRNIKNNHGSHTVGTDKLTIEKWANSEEHEYIEYVRKRLENYIPQKVRRAEIPKANGKMRPLGIPTIGDRLIQQCIKQVLEPICEAKFNKNSYGFRPNRSTHHAIAALYSKINISNLYHIVDIDIKGFFDNVNHSKLLKQMWTLGIRDKNLLCIISKMLKAEVEGIAIPNKGTPQGGILSPLLSNIVLNELDWWISDQWETFNTKKDYYIGNSNSEYTKFRSLRTTSKLKEVYIIRYADDFKLLCRTKEMAEKSYKATVQWLKERLDLGVSPEKSKVIDVRKEQSEFLGFMIGTQNRRNKSRAKQREYVVESHMSEKAIQGCKKTLRDKIIKVQNSPTAANVNQYNATVLGLQNYYKIATHVNIDMNKIAFSNNKVLHNRLKLVWTNRGSPSTTYKKFYKNNFATHYISTIALFPLGDIQHKRATVFNQLICNYSLAGRRLIHDELKGFDMSLVKYLMTNQYQNSSVELNDNKISLYIGQYGMCKITGNTLTIGNMEVHHIKPKSMGGSDKYNNLVWITYEIHKLIHAIESETIEKYLSMVNLDEKQMSKLNNFRLKVGNSIIQ